MIEYLSEPQMDASRVTMAQYILIPATINNSFVKKGQITSRFIILVDAADDVLSIDISEY